MNYPHNSTFETQAEVDAIVAEDAREQDVVLAARNAARVHVLGIHVLANPDRYSDASQSDEMSWIEMACATEAHVQDLIEQAPDGTEREYLTTLAFLEANNIKFPVDV